MDRRDDLIGITEAARMLSVNRATLANWLKQGRLPAVQYGERGIFRLRRGDVIAFIEASRVGARDRVAPRSVATPAHTSGMVPEPDHGHAHCAPRPEEDTMVRTIDDLRRFLAGHGVALTENGLVEALAKHGWLIFHDAAGPRGHEIRAERLVDGTETIVAVSDRRHPDRLGFRLVALMRALEQVIDHGGGTARRR